MALGLAIVTSSNTPGKITSWQIRKNPWHKHKENDHGQNIHEGKPSHFYINNSIGLMNFWQYQRIFNSDSLQKNSTLQVSNIE